MMPRKTRQYEFVGILLTTRFCSYVPSVSEYLCVRVTQSFFRFSGVSSRFWLTDRRINCTFKGRPRYICLSDISPIRYLHYIKLLKKQCDSVWYEAFSKSVRRSASTIQNEVEKNVHVWSLLQMLKTSRKEPVYAGSLSRRASVTLSALTLTKVTPAQLQTPHAHASDQISNGLMPCAQS